MGLLRQILLSLFLLSSETFNSIDKSAFKHIKDIHYPNLHQKIDVVRNEITGVESGIYAATSPKSILGKRKTFFPEDPHFKKNLNFLIKRVPTLYGNAGNKGKLNCIVEYKRDNAHDYLVGIIKNLTGEVKTMYPLLRYISLHELAGKKLSDPIYIASVRDEENNCWVKKFKTVQDIKDATQTGRCLAYHAQKEKLALVDISNDIGEGIFGEKDARNSIAVESDWIDEE